VIGLCFDEPIAVAFVGGYGNCVGSDMDKVRLSAKADVIGAIRTRNIKFPTSAPKPSDMADRFVGIVGLGFRDARDLTRHKTKFLRSRLPWGKTG